MMSLSRKIVAYVRVSTARQGASGLGLESQTVSINSYVAQNNGMLIATYTEIESGRKSDRPQIRSALAHAKRSGAILVVAKLDRLSRNHAFLSVLMDSGVEFVACDNPHANRLTCHILSAVAEAEAIAISERTKSALAAAKARGTLLGASRPQCRNLTDEGRKIGHKRAGETVKAQADAAYTDISGQMIEWRKSGETLQGIADRLNVDGHTTRRGKQWNHVQVRSVLMRFSSSPA